jgi:2-iminobutanoate/2-iminopropanoate deaminase
MIDAFNPPDVWSPFGAFSMGIIQGDGRIVHLKGQVALDRDGQVVAAGDMRGQTRKTLENVRAVLGCVGGTMGEIVSLPHYVTAIAQFMTTGDIRREFFAAPYPVTTTVQVAALYRPELVVEITAIAEIPRDRFRRPPTKNPSGDASL